MLGNPKFKIGDIVESEITLENGRKVKFQGRIEIVDRYGTFFQNDDVSYDIMVDDWLGTGERMFIKHIIESNVVAV